VINSFNAACSSISVEFTVNSEFTCEKRGVLDAGGRALPKKLSEINEPACSEALARLQALLIASRELEEIQVKRARTAGDSAADDYLMLKEAWQKKQRAKAALIAHTIRHGCLPL
jgi:hypothetical protein